MDTLLKQFYKDEHIREAVQLFLNEQLDTMALDKVYAKEDISGIADAKAVIKKAFIVLKETYSDDPKPVIGNSR